MDQPQSPANPATIPMAIPMAIPMNMPGQQYQPSPTHISELIPQPQPAYPNARNTAPDQKKSDKWKIIVVVVIFVLVVLAITFIILYAIDKDKDGDDSTQLGEKWGYSSADNDSTQLGEKRGYSAAEIKMMSEIPTVGDYDTPLSDSSGSSSSSTISSTISKQCTPTPILVKISEYLDGEFSFYEDGKAFVQKYTIDKPKYIAVDGVVYSLLFEQVYDDRTIMIAKNVVTGKDVTAKDIFGEGAKWTYRRLFLYSDKDMFSCAKSTYTSKFTIKPLHNDTHFEISTTDTSGKSFRSKFGNNSIIYMKLANSFDGWADEWMLEKYSDDSENIAYTVYSLNGWLPTPPSHMFLENKYSMFYGDTPVEIEVRPFPFLK